MTAERKVLTLGFSKDFYAQVKEVFETNDVNELVKKLQSGEGWIAVDALQQYDEIRFVMFRI